MRAIEIESLDDPRVAAYRDIKDRDARVRHGLFVVEGRGSLRCLLEDTHYTTRSVLVSHSAHEALRDCLDPLGPATPVYRAAPGVMTDIVGFEFHRGSLALGVRREATSVGELIPSFESSDRPSLVVVMEGLADADNVGVVFRNALAFGVEAILLCPKCHDPLYRKAIRTSIGASLCIPFARAREWPREPLEALRAAGYELIALDPAGEVLSTSSAEAGPLGASRRLALIVGTEGAGIQQGTLALADRRLRIDMAEGVDSVNVSTAVGIALHHFFSQGRAAVQGSATRGTSKGEGAAKGRALC